MGKKSRGYGWDGVSRKIGLPNDEDRTDFDVQSVNRRLSTLQIQRKLFEEKPTRTRGDMRVGKFRGAKRGRRTGRKMTLRTQILTNFDETW